MAHYDFKCAFNSVMNTEELEKIGKKAQRFIYENKGIQQQMSRVIDFALE
jgi:hypothetical protein